MTSASPFRHVVLYCGMSLLSNPRCYVSLTQNVAEIAPTHLQKLKWLELRGLSPSVFLSLCLNVCEIRTILYLNTFLALYHSTYTSTSLLTTPLDLPLSTSLPLYMYLSNALFSLSLTLSTSLPPYHYSSQPLHLVTSPTRTSTSLPLYLSTTSPFYSSTFTPLYHSTSLPLYGTSLALPLYLSDRQLFFALYVRNQHVNTEARLLPAPQVIVQP